jgi:two-component system, OmpR family, sensor kinase
MLVRHDEPHRHNLAEGTGQGEAGTSRRPAKPTRVRSGRVRIVGSLVASVAIALAISITVSYFIALQRLDQRIDQDLTQEVREVAAFAETGIDPVTARPFTDVGTLLRASIERNVVGRNETMIAFVDGQPYARDDQDPPLRLDEQPEVVARLADSTQPGLDTIKTARGTVRYGAVPVRVAGSPETGVFVIAVFRDLERADINSATWTFAAVAFGTLALAAVAALLIAGRVLRPIRLVRQTAQQITATDLSRRIPVEGNDDVAELARTFNGMLDRLQATFEGQRQFLNDASHELRTPITIVQGHLELAESDPSTRTESLAIVMDELERMRSIVEDLLMLARSDSPNFLRVSEVDLEPYIDEVFEKAQALAPRKWYLDHQAEGVALLDRQRITQAMLQLALNATQHTTTDQEIHLGTEIHDDQLHLWVRDTGAGVPQADRERVFDRFARGASTDGDGSGTGLGLAIVRVIAQSHGGTVALVETSSEGAEFRLVLPLQSPEGNLAAPSKNATRELMQ